jgi:hypothetical protein
MALFFRLPAPKPAIAASASRTATTTSNQPQTPINPAEAYNYRSFPRASENPIIQLFEGCL